MWEGLTFTGICAKEPGSLFCYTVWGIEQLEKYRDFARELSENDRKRFRMLLEKEEDAEIVPVLKYMMQHGIKLEQESIRLG